MARSPRLSADDAYFHIFARGNNKQQIFFEDDTYRRFLTNLERFRELHGFSLFAYCLMPNHFHLFLQTHGTPLSKTMQVVMTAYSMFLNKKYKHIGHVFQGRFGSTIVDRETYFLQVIRYIHLNPVKAGLAKTPEDYSWSSYNQYLGTAPNVPHVKTSELLHMLTADTKRQHALLREFTMAGITDAFDPTTDHVRGILGSREFHLRLNRVLGRGRL